MAQIEGEEPAEGSCFFDFNFTADFEPIFFSNLGGDLGGWTTSAELPVVYPGGEMAGREDEEELGSSDGFVMDLER